MRCDYQANVVSFLLLLLFRKMTKRDRRKVASLQPVGLRNKVLQKASENRHLAFNPLCMLPRTKTRKDKAKEPPVSLHYNSLITLWNMRNRISSFIIDIQEIFLCS
jgi:hypothetical protein